MHLRSHIPNWLTYFRILVILPLVGAILQDSPNYYHTAAVLFFLAAISDFLDGYLARLWNVGSSMGRLLDPVADKMVVAAALVALVHTGHAAIWPTILIIFRELFVSGLREFLIESRVILPVSRLAKYKTATQLLAIFVLLVAEALSLPHIHIIGSFLLWASAVLTLITGIGYFTSSLKTIHVKE
ncbi:MAG: CDP-diacylglycerol--glycerol-3-phosphate 3-phosphatidyltransferase [Rickettsiales bacterium]